MVMMGLSAGTDEVDGWIVYLAKVCREERSGVYIFGVMMGCYAMEVIRWDMCKGGGVDEGLVDWGRERGLLIWACCV